MRFKLALTIALVFFGATRVTAQQQRFGSTLDLTMSRFIEPPRALRQALRDAEDAIDQQQYSGAVVILGDLVLRDTASEDATLNNQDFFLDIKESLPQRASESFIRRCHDLIGDLPPSGKKIYQLRYAALAKQLLETATKTRDWEKLREVRRKYFHTPSGYQASLLLAQRELYLGHPLSASLLLDRVVESRDAKTELGQEVIVLHAVACRLAGRPVPSDVWDVDAPIGTGANEAKPVDDWRAWIDARYKFEIPDSLTGSLNYPVLGGGQARNETSLGQLPLSSVRYAVETAPTDGQLDMIRRKSEELAASGKLVPPSWSPILVGDQLLVRTTDRLWGIEHRTGKRVWASPWYKTRETAEPEESFTRLGQSEPDPSNRLTQRVWNDVPYGQITSDGERVFLLNDLSPAQTIQINPLMGFRGTRGTRGGSNTLVALELATEGKTLWRVGKKDATVVSELNEAFFLGAPLPVDGYLYVMIELAGDISLACLDPATGSLQWQQQLVANEGMGVQFNPLRRISGATPTYHEGVLICPTGAGATVAIDLADRTLRWGVTYPRKSNFSRTNNRGQLPNESTEDLLQRWHNPAAIASGLSVIVTPVETDQLFCLELIDGKRRFSKPRTGAFYAAGIRDGEFLVVGAQQLKSYGLEKGKLAWATNAEHLVAGQQIIGRGVFSEDSYIVPASGNELVCFSLEDGSLTERRKVSFPLGNLTAINGEILSQGPTHIAVAEGITTLGPRVEAILKENPNDVDALTKKALLLIEGDQRSEALAMLDRARELDPENAEVVMHSIDAMLRMLRAEETPPAELVAKLKKLVIDDPEQEMQFLAIQLQSALRNKSAELAMEQLLELSSHIVQPRHGGENDGLLGDPSRKCNVDSWLAARTAELAELALEQGKLDDLRTTLAAHLETKRLGSSQVLLRLIEHFRPLGAEELIVSLADRFARDEEYFMAERALIGSLRPEQLLIQSEAGFPVDAGESLCRVYGNGRLGRDALKVLDGIRGTIDEESIGNLTTLAKSGIEAGGASISVEGSVELDWQSSSLPRIARSGSTQKLVDLSNRGGNTFQGWALMNLGGVAMLQNPIGVQRPFTTQMRRGSDQRCTISGGLMLLERPGQVSAIDLFKIRENRIADANLWQRDFGSKGNTVTQRRPIPMPLGDSIWLYPTNSLVSNLTSEFRVGPVLGDRILILQAGDLVAIKAMDGKPIWRNSNAPTKGNIVVDGDRVALVSSRGRLGASLHWFHLADGRSMGESQWDHGDVWATAGKHVLTYQEQQNGSEVRVRLVDPFEDKVVLETTSKSNRPSNADTRGLGRVVQDRFLVLINATGEVTVWDLVKGTQLCSHQTGEMPKLETMRVMWMKGRLLVLAANEIKRFSARDMNTRIGDTHHSVHRMIAISTETGQLDWQRDFEQPWGCTIHQPHASPVIAMARYKSVYSANRSPNVQMDVEMIRLNDGKTIHQVLERSLGPRNSGLGTQLTVLPQLNRVVAQIGGEKLVYQFSDKAPESDGEETEDASGQDAETTDAKDRSEPIDEGDESPSR